MFNIIAHRQNDTKTENIRTHFVIVRCWSHGCFLWWKMLSRRRHDVRRTRKLDGSECIFMRFFPLSFARSFVHYCTALRICEFIRVQQFQCVTYDVQKILCGAHKKRLVFYITYSMTNWLCSQTAVAGKKLFDGNKILNSEVRLNISTIRRRESEMGKFIIFAVSSLIVRRRRRERTNSAERRNFFVHCF